ncbi:MAG TPA: hypothetical protein VK712_04110 [Verrucomicrobiae bacterium]|jgi:hypothetical protein|nr:hypothetical protein [Verrucomicrobiae bacterium]
MSNPDIRNSIQISPSDGPYVERYRFTGLGPHPEDPIGEPAFDQLYDLAANINSDAGITSDWQAVHAYSDQRGTEPAISIACNTLGNPDHKSVYFWLAGGGFSTVFSLRNDCAERVSMIAGVDPVISTLVCGTYSISEKDSLSPLVMEAQLSETALLSLYSLIAQRSSEGRFRQEPTIHHIYSAGGQAATSQEAVLVQA